MGRGESSSRSLFLVSIIENIGNWELSCGSSEWTGLSENWGLLSLLIVAVMLILVGLMQTQTDVVCIHGCLNVVRCVTSITTG